MSITLYPSVAKVKRNGVYENLPGFVQQTQENAAQAMIATAESSNTAQYPHPKNSFFRLNGTLYQADENIAVGNIIAVGTNCHVAVLGDVVSELENDTDSNSETIDAIIIGDEFQFPLNTTWSQGGVNYQGEYSSWSRIRTDYIEFDGIAQLSPIPASGYAFLYVLYDENKTYTRTDGLQKSKL